MSLDLPERARSARQSESGNERLGCALLSWKSERRLRASRAGQPESSAVRFRIS